MSRPFLVKLLETTALLFHKVGTDLEGYRRAVEIQRKAAMEELAAQSQELDMAIKWSNYTVLLDTNVLYPTPLRDLLMEIVAAARR